MEEFKKHKPPMFDKGGQLKDAEEWLREIEQIFLLFESLEQYKVALAEY